jgi:hypothetical protein
MRRLRREFDALSENGFQPASSCKIEAWVGAIAVGVTAVAGIAGAVIQGNAAKSAAQAQEQAAQNANQTQLAELQATAGLQTPGRNLGYGADALLAQLYGLPNPNSATTTAGYGANQSLNAIGGIPGVLGSTATGGAGVGGASGGTSGLTNIGPTGSLGANGAAANTAAGGSALPANAPAGAASQFSNFYNSPGYQFTLQQGEQAINRGASANGSLFTTNNLNQLGTYAEGTASNQYNNYVSQLMGLAGLGAGANNATGAAATTAGNNISANQLSAGNANASGILGSAGAYSGAVNNAGGLLGNYAMLNNLGGSGNGYLPLNNLNLNTDAQYQSLGIGGS